MENTENIKIDEVLEELSSLKHRNEFLERKCEALRLNNNKITAERNEINDQLIAAKWELTNIKKMSMFEFGNKYCSSESLEADGHALAKSLLGGK